ncbi:hypothetical protein KP509_29G040700 [Ceratopteris richardii]|uniref:Uncharacterized protein n=1 Tax=Ceratopteris richardii TaxID=49495 RepID=A0A8T2R791_CERRI|nr:hypothetical protein KP509_29G040700 [Ceratopteris richardii]KAH7291892.1 hypothetical protein KP509_29G040700 [Ceratopteris richardii]
MEAVMKTDLSDRGNSTVETVEGLIDVEHEMGFGEGEDWIQVDVPCGHAKSIIQGTKPRKHVRRMRSQSSSPPRRLAKVNSTKKWPQQGDPSAVRHVTALSVDDERIWQMGSSSLPEVKPSECLHSGKRSIHGNVETAGESKKYKRPPHRHLQKHVKDSGIDEQRTEILPQESTKDVAQSAIKGNLKENSLDPRNVPDLSVDGGIKHNFNQEDTRKIDDQAEMEKRQQVKKRNPNRVRFSLECDTGEELLGGKKITRASVNIHGKEDVSIRKKESTIQDGKIRFGDLKENLAEKGSVPRMRAAGLQRQKEPVTAIDSQKGRDIDLEIAIEMKEDKKIIRLAQDRIERLEGALVRQQEVIGTLRVVLIQQDLKDYKKVRQLLDALEKNIRRLTMARSLHFSERCQLRNRADQIGRLKAHCSMLEVEKERLRKKLNGVLGRDTKEKEKVMADAAAASDMHKVLGSQDFVKEWEYKFKEVGGTLLKEKGIWEKRFNGCQLDWMNKKHNSVVELNKKEMKLSGLKNSQDKLIDLFLLCRQGVNELYGTLQSASAFISQNPLKVSYSSSEECDALELANYIYSNTESLKLLLQTSPFLLMIKQEVPFKTLSSKSKFLDDKFSKTLHLTESVRQEMERKEEKMMKEKGSSEQIITEKVRLLHTLEQQLFEKERVDLLVNELKNELRILKEELHQECIERSQRLPSKQGVQQNREEKTKDEWEKEIEVLKEELNEVRADAALKDGRICCLEEEVKVKADQLAHEKQRWDSAVKEVKRRAARAIVRFISGKENGVLEQFLDRKKTRKMSEGQQLVGLQFKGDEDENTEGISKDIEAPSLRERSHNHNLREQFHNCQEPFSSQEGFEWAGGRGLEKGDVLEILERQRDRGDMTCALLQCTVQGLE